MTPFPMKTLSSLLIAAALLALPSLSRASSASAVIGDSVTITVTADGTQPFAYQWAKNGVDIPGATGQTYSIVAAALADAGTYRARVSNAAGSAVSDDAVLTVLPIAPTNAKTSAVVTKRTAAPAGSTGAILK